MIAIDGPAGAGKSTAAKALALRLGLRYLDSGAMYRAVALKALRLGLHEERAAEIIGNTRIEFQVGDPQRVVLDGEDVTEAIRTAQISEAASSLSQYPAIRKELAKLQQEFIADGGVVIEGRDATTVIAPHADVKVYLTASLEERSKRRHLELAAKGSDHGFEEVRQQVEVRDHRDITRKDSPLTVAPGAVVIETAGLTPAQVVDAIAALLPSA